MQVDSAVNDPCASFDLKTLHLHKGGHGSTFRGEACLLEAANRATVCCPTLGKKYGVAPSFTDDHPSVSRVVRAFGIGLNDAWDDGERQRLVPYVKKILGTKTTEADEQTRAWLAADWLIRVHTPAFLRLAGLESHALALESLARISDATLARAAQPKIDAAYSAARSAARSAAADSAAYSAADSAADSAAYSAADSAARSAAYSAAYAAARSAADSAAYSAAYAAARSALAPTVEALQQSALELFDALIAVGKQ